MRSKRNYFKYFICEDLSDIEKDDLFKIHGPHQQDRITNAGFE